MNRSGDRRFSGIERAVVMTVAPVCLSRVAIASPMPFVPPVTKTLLPSSSVESIRMSVSVFMLNVFVVVLMLRLSSSGNRLKILIMKSKGDKIIPMTI